MKKSLFIFLFTTIGLSSFSQIGLSIGPQLIYGFGSNQLFKGLNFGVEIPRTEQSSILVRAYATLRNNYKDSTYAEAIDQLTSPAMMVVNVRNGISTFGLEGGMRRYFLGSNFDYGFSLYGGSMFSFSLYHMTSKVLSPIDESLYSMPQRSQGSVFMLNFGLNGGMKKQFTFGTLFMDLSLSYAIVATGSAKFNGISSGKLSVLNFGCVLGYRRDLFFNVN
jgi:hypothetical protein